MSETRIFNESVFSSYSNLQEFFNRSNSIKEVLNEKNKPFTKLLADKHPNLTGRWRLYQMATSPIRWSSAHVLNTLTHILRYLRLPSLSKRTKRLSSRIQIGFNIHSINTTHLYFIRKSINNPNKTGNIVNTFPFISESKITDPKVKRRTLISLDKGIRFEHDSGICRGMSTWLIYLYLKTKAQFTDPRVHMAALGKQFSHGGGMDPTLLQSLNLQKGKLLNLKIGTQPQNSSDPIPSPLLKKGTSDWRSSKDQIIQQLQNLPVGEYKMSIPCHSMAYIKINSTLGYFFDPNQGIIEINGNDQGEKLYELFTKEFIELEYSWKRLPSFMQYNTITPITLRS